MKLKTSIFILLTIFSSCIDRKKQSTSALSFKESLNTACFTTKFVVQDNKEITNVNHYSSDGAWQFFSSDEISNLDSVVMVISLKQIVEIDSSILEIADLPPEYKAKRLRKGMPWKKEKISE